ncbi:MAG TPA: MsnO8 family LLM class oxidoreductase, partial [Chitinophagaceae bacterium]|nr:MsnO8 family LLM class oxidoreductase [Chitinophagaceae bacterium]
KRIRIGSGGVMLPHYSALKVAENFKMLETLFPGRIDLGVGRAPGGDRLTASVLNPGNNFSEQDFVQQLFDLQNYLNDKFQPGTMGEKVRAMPLAPSVPQQWILSSSGQSGLFAAHFGMGFSFAHFINPVGGAQAIQMYQSRFKPSLNLEIPEANMAIFYFCSDDKEEVKKQQALLDHRFLQFEKGVFESINYDEIKDVSYTAYELSRIDVNRQRAIIGDREEVNHRLTTLANEYGVDEIILVNIASEFKERLRSYEIAAELFGLNKEKDMSH